MVSLLQILLLGALLAGSTQAATVVSFNWNDLPIGSYYLDVQMASGDGVSGNNSASVKLLSSQNLSFVSPALLNGWASESSPLDFNILDDDPSLAPIPDILNGILLSFTVDAAGPGGFQVELNTSNLFSGVGLQDSLTMAILNESFFSTYEENAVGLPLLTALFDGDGSLEFIVNAANVAPYDSIGSPQVEESTIPEPSTWLGAAFGLAVVALRKKLRVAALSACVVVGPACAQQAWIVQDVNVSVNSYMTIYGQSIVQYGNDIVFAGRASSGIDEAVGLYKFNTISRQGARFATLPVVYAGLASAAQGLVITVEDSDGPYGAGSLWLSDGTSAGTKKVTPTVRVLPFKKIQLPNGILLFSTQSQNGGPVDLWRSDGTVAGTYRLAQGAGMSRGVVFNGQAYFPSNGQLWKSDGTIQGTGPALTGVAGLESVGNNLLVERGGLLYFLRCQPVNGCEFWSTNGTGAGTQLAAGVISRPGALGDLPALGVFNDIIFFPIRNSSGGYEIWKTNGSTAGTSMVKSMSSYLFEGLPLNNALVFQVDGGALWRTDGTEAGTYALSTDGSWLTKISADTALFIGNTTAEGREVWKSNGTLAGTSIVRDLNPGPSQGASDLYGFNGKAYFTGSTGVDGGDFWETDGSATGTRLAFNFNKVNNGISPKPLISLGGFQYFQALGNQTCDLYRTDGTRAGTVKSVSLPGDCDLAIPLDNLLIFGIRNATALEVWKTNGTQQGTLKIGDLPPFVFSSGVRSGDRVYLNHNSLGGPTIMQNTLYVTDGQSLTALFTTPGSLNPGLIKIAFAPFGQRSLLFSASTTPGVAELYATDGTPQATGLLANYDSNGSSSPLLLQNLNGMVYFNATVSGVKRLFRSSGTLQGTIAVAQLPSEASEPYLSEDNTTDLFLRASQSALLRFNTVSNSLTSVNVDFPGPPFVTRNGITYFPSNTPGVGNGISRTDGTSGGTYSLGDLDPQDNFGPSISNLFWVGNHLYFQAVVGNRSELWRTDGLTTPVRAWTINPPTASVQMLDQNGYPVNRGSFPQFLGILPNGRGLISADDGVRGQELWALDDAPCSAAADLSPQLTITAPAPSINRLTDRAVQTVRIRNNGAALHHVAYIASGLNTQHDIFNRHGLTQCFTPIGPYRDIGSIGSGQTVTLVLEFVLRPGVPFSYSPRIIAREGAR